MRIRLIPEPLYMQNLRYIRNYGSEGAQVQRLMEAMKRETNMLQNREAVVNNPEDFPNQITRSSTNVIRRLLDII